MHVLQPGFDIEQPPDGVFEVPEMSQPSLVPFMICAAANDLEGLRGLDLWPLASELLDLYGVRLPADPSVARALERIRDPKQLDEAQLAKVDLLRRLAAAIHARRGARVLLQVLWRELLVGIEQRRKAGEDELWIRRADVLMGEPFTPRSL